MNRRLTALLLVLTALAALNWLDRRPQEVTDVQAVVPAAPRLAAHAQSSSQRTAAVGERERPKELTGMPRPLLAEPTGDPFSSGALATNEVSPPAAPPPPPEPPPPPVIASPPPSFSLQAVGRWEEDGRVVLFLQRGTATVLAKVGDDLPGGFRLTQIDKTSFQVTHVESGEVSTRSIGSSASGGAPVAQRR